MLDISTNICDESLLFLLGKELMTNTERPSSSGLLSVLIYGNRERASAAWFLSPAW